VFDENGNGFININNTGWQVLPVVPDPLGLGALAYGPFHQPVVPGILGILEGQGSSTGTLSDTLQDIQVGVDAQGPVQVLRFLSDSGGANDNDLADNHQDPLPQPTFFLQEQPILLPPGVPFFNPQQFGVFYDSGGGTAIDNRYWIISDANVPEPSSFVLIGIGVTAWCAPTLWRRRRRLI
jgi:hypothetical protein